MTGLTSDNEFDKYLYLISGTILTIISIFTLHEIQEWHRKYHSEKHNSSENY